MLRRNWKKLLLVGIIGMTLIGTLAGLIPMGYGLLVLGGTMYAVWLTWSLTKKPRRLARMLAPVVTAGILALLGFYASECFPTFGTGAHWCL
jgi:hypothetical protein